MDSREVTRDIRHAIAEALLSEGVEWTGLHDNAIDSPIERSVHPLTMRVEALETALRDQIELWKMARDTMNIADARMHRVKFMEFHDPIKAARTALEDRP